jgi:hypothetical protein
MIRLGYELIFQPSVGPFGHVEMTLSLTSRIPIFCRLFAALDSAMGVLSPGGSAGDYGYWLLTVAQDFFFQSGGILEKYQMDSFFMRLMFLWLIHVSILLDP